MWLNLTSISHGGRCVRVNFDTVTRYYYDNRNSKTFLYFLGSKEFMEVKETSDQIDEMIKRYGRA